MLASKAGGSRGSCARIISEGAYDAGGAGGTYRQVVDMRDGKNRTDLLTGPLREESGFDGAPWTRHDGILVSVDMSSSIREARSRAFLARFGWRDPAARRFTRLADGKASGESIPMSGIVVDPPGADRMSILFDPATHRPSTVEIDADGGPLRIRYSDWRRICGTSVPFQREETDATGQVTRYRALTVVPSTAFASMLARPPGRNLGTVPVGGSTVHFELDHVDRGHIVVPASLNGGAVKLIFDTGAANYLTPETATARGIKTSGGVNIGGVGTASYSGGYGVIGRLVVGDATLTDTVAMIATLPPAATNPRPGLAIQGLIGFEMLSQFRTVIDYRRQTLAFAPSFRPLPRGRSYAFRTDGNAIYVEARVEGVRGWFRLDTGDGGTVTLFRTFATRSGLKSDAVPVIVPGQVGGSIATRGLILKTFTIGDRTLTNLKAELADQSVGAFASKSIAGNIGAGVLSRFRLMIDFRTHRLMFRPNGIRSEAVGAGE